MGKGGRWGVGRGAEMLARIGNGAGNGEEAKKRKRAEGKVMISY